MADNTELGIKTPFLSNSFSAFRSNAFDTIGGFPENVILGEDMAAAARLLLLDWKIAYVAEACAYHSHDYSWREEFRRYFDIGVFHAQEPWLLKSFSAVNAEAIHFVGDQLRYLVRTGHLHHVPGALFANVLKKLGYTLGRHEKLIPYFVKRYLSMHRRYWLGGSRRPFE